MLDALDRQERLQLMKFICSFAWADLRVNAGDTNFINAMAERLDLDEAERRQVKAWLEVPPRAEDVDPEDIPHEKRQIFIDAAKALILADGKVDPTEVETLTLFQNILQGEAEN